jgi:glycerophosphoryl diester phosphodiesterase
MTKIIGHRGARGIELENSLASIQTALALDVDALEFDVHRTSDGKIVVLHDASTRRVADKDVRVNETSFDDLQKLKLNNGQSIPRLEDVLEIVGSKPIFIDIKDADCAGILVQILKRFPKVRAGFVSTLPSELQKVRELQPETPTYIYFLKAKTIIPRPIKMVRVARDIHATGIAIDKLFLNPITYYLARRSGMQMYTYSVGTASLARFFKLLYPHIDFATSRPDRLRKAIKQAS